MSESYVTLKASEIEYIQHWVDHFAVSWTDGEWYGSAEFDDDEIDVRGDTIEEVVMQIWREVEQIVTSGDFDICGSNNGDVEDNE